MIKHVTGNLLESQAQALVNTVNTVGVMGKGIALQFKKEFPNNYKIYRKACENNELTIGQLLITKEETMILGKKIIVNFPTKKHWRENSEYSYIEQGLIELRKFILQNHLTSIAIPPLGTGNGGLNWIKVKTLIEKYLSDLETEILIYQPNTSIQETLKKERVKLTPARAMLLAVLYELVKNGEFVSEFAAEKIAYFLQRFGATEEFNLTFEPIFYGPYSGKIKHVLYHLNRSYILGYSTKDKKPFEEIELLINYEDEILDYLKQFPNKEYLNIVDKTKHFLNGFYSPFALELLSTIDFISEQKQSREINVITTSIQNWNMRKTELFSNTKYIAIALEQLQTHL